MHQKSLGGPRKIGAWRAFNAADKVCRELFGFGIFAAKTDKLGGFDFSPNFKKGFLSGEISPTDRGALEKLNMILFYSEIELFSIVCAALHFGFA